MFSLSLHTQVFKTLPEVIGLRAEQSPHQFVLCFDEVRVLQHDWQAQANRRVSSEAHHPCARGSMIYKVADACIALFRDEGGVKPRVGDQNAKAPESLALAG